MRLWDRVREWAGLSDAGKVSFDRRAFLKGMVVTSAGLVVPGAAVFDMGRIVKPRNLGGMQIFTNGNPWLAVGDRIRVSGVDLTGAGHDEDYYVVTKVTNTGLYVADDLRVP
jgi:hypothetical protein